jgi:IS30 family transposase
MGYRHLSIDERDVILKMVAQQSSLQTIGAALGRDPGTISREVRRNIHSSGEYRPNRAQQMYERRRAESKEPYRLEEDAWLGNYVLGKLKRYWSPEQISGRLQRDRGIVVSPGTLYRWIYRDHAGGGGTLWRYLRRHHRRRRRHRGSERRGQIAGRRMIDRRPKVVEARRRIGDWESDTVEGGKGLGLLATHVERKSRYTVAVKVSDKSAPTVTRATVKGLRRIPVQKRKTMTLDNGKEFSGFAQMERRLGIRIYFAHPYHSWERGTNENTNGLLRQFFPKGTDFTQVTDSEVDRVERLLNNRPRKCLGYRTPAEVFWDKPKCCASD